MTKVVAMYNFIRYQLPVILWGIAIFVSSSLPSSEIPRFAFLKHDKIIHGFIFLIFCALTHRAVKHQNVVPSLAAWSLSSSLIFTIAYGALDEFHQMYVPGRDSNIYDLLADFVGGSVYLLLALSYERFFSSRHRPRRAQK